ncbi:E2/UBC family protein [Mycobacterium avium]|uniref:E2/UBC family protein n=1 Tax=Mycobacterium avium TaxID=1764 RepID=UPI001CC66281|nr:E2/UBC family protein [Mycobacterium avium]
MTDDNLVEYLRGLGLSVEAMQDSGLAPYIVVRNVEVPQGTLAGRICDVAIARCPSVPYVCPPAIHTRPALVEMDMAGPLKTQASSLGAEWQYWSRRFDRAATPQLIWAHVLSVLSEV